MKRPAASIVSALVIMGFITSSAIADDTTSGTQIAAAPNGDNSSGNIVKAILDGYRGYLQLLTNLMNENDPQSAKTADQTAPAQPSTVVPVQGASQPQVVSQQQSAPQQQQDPSAQGSSLQTSSLHTSHVQAAGPLSEAHLAGYPALPDVAPTSSVLYLTQEQIARKVQMDREQARLKQFYLEHP